jgi:hypothetical protein
MTSRPTYGVTVEREDQLWTASVDGLPAGTNTATDTEHFAELEQEVRDFIATVTDTEPDDFDLVWRYVQAGVDYTAEFTQAKEWENRLREAEAAREDHRAAAAAAMAQAGIPLRAIGDALQLSHQRIGQILKDKRKQSAASSPSCARTASR